MNNLRVYRLKLRLFLFLGLHFSAINDMAVINNSLVLCKKMWMRERDRERERRRKLVIWKTIYIFRKRWLLTHPLARTFFSVEAIVLFNESHLVLFYQSRRSQLQDRLCIQFMNSTSEPLCLNLKFRALLILT